MLLFGAIIVVFERGLYNLYTQQYTLPNGDAATLRSIPQAMYWCMTTMTTVGYGDIYPVTPGGWVVGIFAQLMGIVVLSLPITVIGATFSEEYEEQNRINEREKRLLRMKAPNQARGSRSQRVLRRLGVLKQRVADGGESGGDGGEERGALGERPVADEEAVSAAAHAEEGHVTFGDSAAKADAAPVPGYQQCEWLLSDYRSSSLNDIKAMMRRNENDLLRMSRRVIIQSRVTARHARKVARGSKAPTEDDDGLIAEYSRSRPAELSPTMANSSHSG